MTAVFVRNHYERLQVGKNASASELTQAFRKLAKQYHPDVARETGTNHVEVFHSIRESYEVLSDPHKRHAYDRQLSTLSRIPPSKPFHYKNGFNGAKMSRYSGKRKSYNPLKHDPNLDVEAAISIDLKKVFSGGTQSVNLNKAPAGTYPLRSQVVNVEIAKNCVEGEKIHVPFKGRYNPSKGLVGHLNLKIEFAADEEFKIRGVHLYTSLEIFPWDAAIGALFPIQTPAGKVTLVIPAGTHQWQTFRMQGSGLPRQGGGSRGDLFVYVKIKSIQAKSADQIHLWKALKKSYTKES